MTWDLEQLVSSVHRCDAPVLAKERACGLIARLGTLVSSEMLVVPEPNVCCADAHIELSWEEAISLWFLWAPVENGEALTLVYYDDHIRFVRDPTDYQISKYLRRLLPRE